MSIVVNFLLTTSQTKIREYPLLRFTHRLYSSQNYQSQRRKAVVQTTTKLYQETFVTKTVHHAIREQTDSVRGV